MAKLTATQVTKLAKSQVGRHADGGGLYLVVPTTTSGEPGNPYWMFRYSVGKKRREMTLGKLNDMSLAQARALAAQQSALVREGQTQLP